MAYTSYNKLWENDFDNIVFKKDKVKDININHLKFEVPDSYEKDEKTTTNFEHTNDVINKAYLDEKVFKINGRLSLLEKLYNEILINYNKQSVEETFSQRAVKTIIQNTF